MMLQPQSIHSLTAVLYCCLLLAATCQYLIFQQYSIQHVTGCDCSMGAQYTVTMALWFLFYRMLSQMRFFCSGKVCCAAVSAVACVQLHLPDFLQEESKLVLCPKLYAPHNLTFMTFTHMCIVTVAILCLEFVFWHNMSGLLTREHQEHTVCVGQ